MNIKNKDIVREEFIGMRVKVLHHTDPNLINTEGKIIDETKNMFTILTKNNKKIKIQKRGAWFLFKDHYHKKYFKIVGDIIAYHPRKRLTKKYPKKWKSTL